MRGIIQQNSVPVDPTVFNKTHIVVNNEFIYERDQSVIPGIGENVWLHDGNFHN
jgi:hypothetical protein